MDDTRQAAEDKDTVKADDEKTDIDYKEDDQKLPALVLENEEPEENVNNLVLQPSAVKQDENTNDETHTDEGPAPIIKDENFILQPSKDTDSKKDMKPVDTETESNEAESESGNAARISPAAVKSNSNDEPLNSDGNKILAGEPIKTNSPSPSPVSGKVNAFFIIIPGIVIAFVVFIVIAFVIYQKTSLFRSSEYQPPGEANHPNTELTHEKRTIYKQVPTDPSNAV